MNHRIFLQKSENNFERYEYCKNKTNIFLPLQYSVSFPGKNYEEVYIIFPTNLHIGKDMDSGHYICDVLDYNTGTWWNCDDNTITNYSGCPENIYDNLSNENEQKGVKLYHGWIIQDCFNTMHKIDILSYITYNFCTEKSVSKDIENIKEITSESKVFKEEFGKN